VGVLHRVEELADRRPGLVPEDALPFKRLVPLEEIIAAVLGQGVGTMAVRHDYDRLIEGGGNEFAVLVEWGEEELAAFTPPRILKAILRVREGLLTIVPGYDGVYGTIKVLGDELVETLSPSQPEQMDLF
jgi:PHP family Zn ribbon phosphoesterase